MASTLLVERPGEKGDVVVITLNRPRRLNAMSFELMQELYDTLCALETDARARVVVLVGAGKGFCSGADLVAAATGHGGRRWKGSEFANQQHFSRVILKLAAIPQPVIACVHGHAAGGGFALALAADVRLAGESFKGHCAFVRLGLSGCEMGSSFFLPRYVGHSVASELMLTGDVIAAPRALATGLVSAVHPDAALLAEGVALAHFSRRCRNSFGTSTAKSCKRR